MQAIMNDLIYALLNMLWIMAVIIGCGLIAYIPALIVGIIMKHFNIPIGGPELSCEEKRTVVMEYCNKVSYCSHCDLHENKLCILDPMAPEMLDECYRIVRAAKLND